jgi:phosphoribosylglycinamide formyltransferase-1
MINIAVFASGTGSNFERIADTFDFSHPSIQVGLLVCDKPHAPVIEKAKNRNIDIFSFNPKHYQDKQAFEKQILAVLLEHNIHFIVLAGYMRLIGPTLLQAYPKKIVNIHPSLLPSFPGLDAVGQAMKAGVKVTGVTIHYVDEGMDTGTILAQQALDISTMSSRAEIEQAIHEIEHQLYPTTIKQLLEVTQ